MFNIGEFARLSQIAVRMPRHYDELRLLRPAPGFGYASLYRAQLHGTTSGRTT
jgi:DNA-binding transcriptional MerR regulator